MTIALEIYRARRSTALVRTPLHQPLTAWVRRVFWHTHAYTTIFGIMVLVCLGIVLLHLYEIGRKPFRTIA